MDDNPYRSPESNGHQRRPSMPHWAVIVIAVIVAIAAVRLFPVWLKETRHNLESLRSNGR